MPATVELDILFPPDRIEFVLTEPMSEDALFDLCQQADPLRLERVRAPLIELPPSFSDSLP